MGTFTLATGLGMFAFGMIAFAIGATAFFIITRKIENNKKEEAQLKRQREQMKLIQDFN